MLYVFQVGAASAKVAELNIGSSWENTPYRSVGCSVGTSVSGQPMPATKRSDPAGCLQWDQYIRLEHLAGVRRRRLKYHPAAAKGQGGRSSCCSPAALQLLHYHPVAAAAAGPVDNSITTNNSEKAAGYCHAAECCGAASASGLTWVAAAIDKPADVWRRRAAPSKLTGSFINVCLDSCWISEPRRDILAQGYTQVWVLCECGQNYI
jgi:hypothetical protein